MWLVVSALLSAFCMTGDCQISLWSFLEAVSKIALRGRMLQRTHLINRKGVTFAQDRRPLERLSDIFETASIQDRVENAFGFRANNQRKPAVVNAVVDGGISRW